ncbi:MAG: Tim44/TimA family putative adaptor protein [Rickettsiales bacterium]|nr:Tim44/TimA family putative adaptor protein [Rickettsiales bacterium]
MAAAMNAYDVLALLIFAAVAAAAWRTFRADEGAGHRIAPETNSVNDAIRTMKRKTIPHEEAPKGKDGEDIAELASRLAHLDRHFEPQSFMENAKLAFSEILRAFEGGNKDRLKELVSPEAFGPFAREMDAMAAKGRKMETEIVRFKRIFIKNIEIGKRGASIVVEFQTEQTTLLKDKSGKVIAGDDNQIEDVRDVWKFTKDFSEKHPAWILEETLKAS